MSAMLAFLLGYASGSIPFGLLLTRAAGMGDVRSIGSGNIGATNVLRTGNKGLAAGTLLLDFLKGLVPVLLAGWLWANDGPLAGGASDADLAMSLAALGAVLGHCFPVWLRFRGGKGVATNAGVAFGLGWPIGLAYAAVWIAMLALIRISSVAGMSAVVAAALAALLLGYERFAPVLALIALIIVWLHRANIARLMKGEEPRVGQGK